MKYRVHLYVTVRAEQEVEADSAEAAARQAVNADRAFFERFDRPEQGYAEEIDDWCLVDPLTCETDSEGRLVPDCENSQWLQLTDLPPADDNGQNLFADEPHRK